MAIRYGGVNRIKQLEEAAGIESAEPVAPVSAPATPVSAPQPSGFQAAPYTGPRPWRGETVPFTPAPAPKRSLLSRAADYLSGASALNVEGVTGLRSLSSLPRRYVDRSTMGSPPFSKAELKQGYRKVGKGKK